MAFKLFEFVEQFLMDPLVLKLTQFEKTGSIRQTLISLGNLITNLFSKSEVNHVFRDLHNFAVR